MNEVSNTVRKASDHPAVEWGARLGYVANAIIHFLLAWLTAQIALSSSSGQASQSGALAQVAQEPFGAVLLWVMVVGFALLALWQLTEVFTSREASDKAKSGAKAVLYAALTWTSATFAMGGHSSSNKQSKDFTKTLMDLPGGQFLVGLVGLGVLGVGAYHVYKGWKKKFLEDLEEHPGQWAVYAGRVGYIAKGIALGSVGVLFIVAAVQHAGGKATGLDGALRSLRDLPAGTVILLGIALGLAAYGVYSIARARHARL